MPRTTYGPCAVCGAEVKRRRIVMYQSDDVAEYLCGDCSRTMISAALTLLDPDNDIVIVRPSE